MGAATALGAAGSTLAESGRAIVLLSDGTGNSAAKLAKTNVWRLYQALDLEPGTAAPQQLAYYDDGVGTSAFRPLALLGGAFGVGLKRNVLDLYKFLCRNYQPGDRIYAFGFSRGAFTIRLLVGLVAQEGLVKVRADEELERHAADAYRAFRQCFQQTRGLVGPLRWVRDHVIALKRRVFGQTSYAAAEKTEVPSIEFVGVWDTVAAYGMPISELTRGIDQWVWPLSMPDYVLSPKVKMARHALALDDERDTFHPLLWDEVEERRLVAQGKVKEGRIQQVWFPGVHADVGGGYADDGMSHVPLLWMMEAAGQGNAGLRFIPHTLEHLRLACHKHGPMHDSRQGLAGYYRYQPRRIGARLEYPDRESRIMQDPGLKDHSRKPRGLLTAVRIHESVLERIRSGADRYAPIVLPNHYEVVVSGGSPVPPTTLGVADRDRALRQEQVWDQVWQRRIVYFATVIGSALLAIFPLIQGYWPFEACPSWACANVSPALNLVGEYVPDVLPGPPEPAWWTHAFAQAPLSFLVLAGIVITGLLRGATLQRRIHDRMREVWDGVLVPDPQQAEAMNAAVAAGMGDVSKIYRIRSNGAYQAFFRALKWWIIPWIFGLGILWAGFSSAVWLIPRLVERVPGYLIGAPGLIYSTVTGGILTAVLVGSIELHRFTRARRTSDAAGSIIADGEQGSTVPAE